MRIDRLIVQNFDGFDAREFKFNQHFNLLVGDNATGKTSVLDALTVAVGSWFLGMRGYVKAFPGIEAEEVRVVAFQYHDKYSFEKQFPSRIEAHGFVMGENLTWTRQLRCEKGRTTSSEAHDIINAASEAQRKVQAGATILLPLICTYGTERLWIERGRELEAPTGIVSRLDGYRDCINFTIEESALLGWIRAETSASQQLGSETGALRAVKKAIIACVEGALSLYYDERYRDLVVDMSRQGHQLFKNLSDGQRIVLTLVGDLVRRTTTLNPHLGDNALTQTPGVVLIDEVDLHLHPKWQRHIVRDLRNTFPSIQFIATTHSPQLVGEAQPEEVILLHGDQEPSNPTQSFGMDSNWILRHVMGTDERDAQIKVKLKELEALINDFQFGPARAKAAELRSEIGDYPDLARLSARIDRFERTQHEANH